MSTLAYPGAELGLFRDAVRWKHYCAQHLTPFLRGEVLEVGAGLGTTARALATPAASRWTCLEPDPVLTAALVQSLASTPLPVTSRVINGTVADLRPGEAFDAVIYVDVLEHIEDHAAELATSTRYLRSGGHLVVLAPAHQWLFSPFDQAIGHHRRYSRATLIDVAPPELLLERAFYLDSVGLFASLANRVILRARYPTARQIRFWDTVMVPISRWLDVATGHRIGKTVVAVWTRPDAGGHARPADGRAQ